MYGAFLSKKPIPMSVRSFLWLNLLIISALLFDSCSFFMTRQEPIPTGIVDADNPNIQYIGRFYAPNPKIRVFDWPGVQICAKFQGTSCSIRLTDKKNEYAVIVDHRAPRILIIDSTIGIYCVASDLVDSLPHSIILQKRTESLVGKGIFYGFILDRGRTLLPPEKRPERRIEFIGNSMTSGYGVEGESPDCHFSPQTENACMSYASMTARELNADYHLISYSGRGMVRNYGDSSTTSINPMPALYDRICYSDTIHKWNFTSWVPQVVVINLGTNDFTTQPYPIKNIFQEAYDQLIDRIRSQYPGITMFCVCGPMIAEPCTGYIREVVERQQKRSRDKDVFFVEVKPDMLGKTDWGCDKHPSITGMSKITDILSRAIKIRMSW